MRTIKYLSMAVLAAATLTFASCSEDEDKSGKPSIDDIVEDGFYVSGDALPFAGIDVKGRMMAATNEADENKLRDGLVNIFMTLEGGKNFSFTEVKGSSTKNYGPEGDAKFEQPEGEDQYFGTIYKGNYLEGTSFKVEETGLYHLAIDQQSKRFVIVPVKDWCIIGNSTLAGWSNNAEINVLPPTTYTKDKVVYSRENITLKEGVFKFRYSGAWKQKIDEEGTVKVNTNFSGTSGELADNMISFTNLTPGGADANLTKDHRGIYTVTVTWELGKENYEVSIKKTGDAVIADYPETLWLRGNAIGGDSGWEEANSLKFIKVPGMPNIFWCIAFLTEGGEFKMDPTNKWNGDFGKSGEGTKSENGIEYAKGGDNIKFEGTSGYYLISVDLKEEKIFIVDDVKIFLIGDDQTGGWNDNEISAGTEFRFEESGEEFISPELKNGVLRMFATVPYIDFWWRKEFHSIDGKLVHRETESEATPAKVVAGQRVYLNFKNGTATIK